MSEPILSQTRPFAAQVALVVAAAFSVEWVRYFFDPMSSATSNAVTTLSVILGMSIGEWTERRKTARGGQGR